jgi:hypothetical protein
VSEVITEFFEVVIGEDFFFFAVGTASHGKGS